MQLSAMREYAGRRGWTVAAEVSEIGSGAKDREKRQELLKIARRREIDAVVVWRLDRWGRSLVDLVTTLGEFGELGVGFVSLTEALDLTTPTGRAMAGLLAVFAEFERDILRERVKAGIAQARAEGRPHGRPRTAALQEKRVKEMHEAGLSKSEIARRLSIGRTSARRMLQGVATEHHSGSRERAEG
jgi:putative DNA-invertase from lambdoid prophage Rac